MTSFQMQSQFLKLNLLSMTGCVLIMYFTVIKWKMGIEGFMIGFVSRFLIEILYEVIYLLLNYPDEAKLIPSFKSVTSGLISTFKFSITFVIGFSVEVFLFETVSFIFFHAPNPNENIALYMSLYQVHISGIFILKWQVFN